MFLRSFLLYSHLTRSKSSWRLGFTQNLRRIRRFNNSLYSKCEDVEKGLKHQYIENKAYNNNENELKSTSNNNLIQDKSTTETSRCSVYIRRGLKAVASLLVLILASFIALKMDNIYYAILLLLIALLSIVFISGVQRWFYIAAVTFKRDMTWVAKFKHYNDIEREPMD